MSDNLKKLQQRSIDYLVFSGGGAKGVAYTGAYSALTDNGVIPNVKAVAGTSAGAITAAAIATGITAEKYRDLTKSTSLPKLIGKPTLTGMDGIPLFNIIEKTIKSNILQYLGISDIKDKCRERTEDVLMNLKILDTELGRLKTTTNGGAKDKETNIEKIEILNDQIQELSKQKKFLEYIAENGDQAFQELKERCDSKGKIYFRDINLLRALEPEKFKDLVITATRKSTGELKIFSNQLTPDVEIALACKASAAIPIFFQPVKIDGVNYVDGGYRDNFPSNHFEDSTSKQGAIEVTNDSNAIKRAKDKTQGRSLCFAFGSDMNDKANIAIYSAIEKIYNPSFMMKFLIDVIFKFVAAIGGHHKYTEEENFTYKKMRKDALSTVVVDTKDVKTLSFSKAEKNANYLHIKAHNNVANHLQNHELSYSSDSTLDLRNLALHTFEEINNKNSTKWTGKVNREVLEEILSFANPDMVKSFNRIELIQKFSLLMCNKKTSNATSQDAFLKVINDGTLITDKLKEDLLKVMSIDKTVEPTKLNVSKSQENDIRNFKFTKADLDKHAANNISVAISSLLSNHQRKI